MHTKDYILVADVIKESYSHVIENHGEYGELDQLKGFINNLSDKLKEDNNAFNKERFYNYIFS